LHVAIEDVDIRGDIDHLQVQRALGEMGCVVIKPKIQD